MTGPEASPKVPATRPSRSPIALCPRDEQKADLLALKRHMCDRPLDPAQLRCSLHDVDGRPMVAVGYAARTVGIPVLGTWPVDDLSPTGLVELVREIVAGIVPSHEDVVREYAATALAACVLQGLVPEGSLPADGGPSDIDVCMDAECAPIFWLERQDGGHFRLPIDLSMLESFMGPMPKPCHIHDVRVGDRWFDAIGPSANDEEGVTVRVSPLDPMTMLRLARHVEGLLEEARAVALGDEA